MKPGVARVLWPFRRIRVFALVGKSGTGKSFRARLIIDKYNIDLTIDDGLLIRDQKIIAGRSAKRETAYLSAVKTALFTDKDHRRKVRNVLERERFRRILIIGTSDRMVVKIAEALKLPSPHKIVQIEDIATAEEIKTAMTHRASHGSHVIPVPSVEVRRNYPRIVAESVKILLKRGMGLMQNPKLYEKTVVRPVFSSRGSVSISQAALTQMIMHCVAEYAPDVRISKVTVRNEPTGYRLLVHVSIPFGSEVPSTVHGLQDYTIDKLEKYTGIFIRELNVVIEDISG
jgi:adenylate kinase family enzyme